MHKLPEEVPLLVDNFGTLFLIHFKLRLILYIFWTTSTFCQLALTCSLTSFVRSLVRLALPSLRCGRFAAHLLTHFVRSLVCLALPSVTLCPPFGHSWCSLRSPYCTPLGRAIELTSFRAWCLLTLALKDPLGRYTTSSHFVHTCCIAWFSNFSSIIPHCDIEFAFRFALYNSLSRVHEIVQFVRTITFFDSPRPCFRKNTPFSFHLDCSIACTITF